MLRFSNPFDGRKVDLSKKLLSTEAKSFLGNLVVKEGKTTREVAEFYNLGKSRIARYSQNICNSILNQSTSGRPSKWDSLSTKTICDQLDGEKRIQINSENYLEMMKAEAEKLRKGVKLLFGLTTAILSDLKIVTP